MDAKFLNTYNEVILDNFNAVLKQNFLFQTQIKVLEEQVKEKSELETKLASLSSENNDIVELRGEIDGLKDELNNKNLAIQNLNNTDSERHRLQTAVNNQMKEIEGLKSQVGSLQNGKDSVIKLLKDKEKEQLDYIAQLEEMLPNSKKKKLGIELPTTEKELTIPVKDEMNVLKFTSNGGTF